MSNSVNPWIVDYLLDVAREFGAKLFDVQPYGKKKKVQIIEVGHVFRTIHTLIRQSIVPHTPARRTTGHVYLGTNFR